LDKFFEWITNQSTKRPKILLLFFILFTIIMLYLSSGLKLELTYYGFVPKNAPAAREFKKVTDNFGNNGGVMVAIENPNPESLVTIAREVRDSLIERKDFVKDIVLEYPTDFYINHGLMLLDTTVLKRSYTMLSSVNLDSFLLNLNNMLEQNYVDNESDIESQEFEVVGSMSSIGDLLEGLNEHLKSNKDTLLKIGALEQVTGPLYMKSLDNKMILMFITPAIDMAQMDAMVKGIKKLRKTIAYIEKRHNNTKIRDTGMFSVGADEYETGLSDSTITTIVSLILVFLLFFIAFKIWYASILAGITLLAGIIWTLGLTKLFVGRLNMLTAFVGVILIGLGIDYSIHIFQAATEKGGINLALKRVGRGVIAGALTTAAAFFALTFTSFQILQELGQVIALGVIMTVFANIFLLPSLIRLFGKKIEGKNAQFPQLGKFAQWSSHKLYFVLILILLLLLVTPYFVHRIPIVSNPLKLERKGLASVKTMNLINKRFGLSADYVMTTASSIDESYNLYKKIKKVPGVGFVDCINLYIPSQEHQKANFPYLKKLNKKIKKERLGIINKLLLLSQLKRLEDNITELRSTAYLGGLDRAYTASDALIKSGEFDSLYKQIEKASLSELNSMNSVFYNTLKPALIKSSTPKIITLDMIPPFIKDRYVAQNNNLFLLSIYTDRNLWNETGNGKILDRIAKIKPITGMVVLMHILWNEGKKESGKALILVFITIFIILLLDFKDLKASIIAMLPVLFATLFTLTTMGILRVQLNFMNVLALPLIIGIGVDDAVHIIHRYRKEPSVNYVFTHVGRAILYTSLTTMAAFGSLLLAKYRGYPTFGAVVLIGVTLAFLMTVLITPPLLKYIKK